MVARINIWDDCLLAWFYNGEEKVKTGIWVLAVTMVLIFVLMVTMSGLVVAKQGIEGLEAYTLALQSIVAIAQSAFQAIGSVVAQSGGIIVQLFNSAVAP